MTLSSTYDPRLQQWLAQVIESGGSDLHLVPGHPPVQRLHGDLVELAAPPLVPPP